MKKLEKKLACPRCGCKDAITPLQKFNLFGGSYCETRCRQCGCALANVWWFGCMVMAGIVGVAMVSSYSIKFLQMHTNIPVTRGSLYEWCVFAFFGCLYLCIVGMTSLYFIPNRESWDGYKKK